jgi:hypothetical protein
MMLGPLSAPSSPPEMPAPTKWRPFARTSFSRRIVSVNSALPPSTMMSPSSNASVSCSMTASVPGLDHDDRGAGTLQRGGELLDRGGGDEARLGVLLDEVGGLLGGAVVHRDRVALAAGEVAGEVGPHHREPHHPDVRRGLLVI